MFYVEFAGKFNLRIICKLKYNTKNEFWQYAKIPDIAAGNLLF